VQSPNQVGARGSGRGIRQHGLFAHDLFGRCQRFDIGGS
jgi:hypothetical protein